MLTPAQETVVLHLRRTLLLPLNGLLAVTREFICPPCLTRWLGSLSAPPWRGQAQRPQTPRACDNTQGLAALREPNGNHEFDQRCRELGIEHRLTKPKTPITTGMVERFNGHLADVLKSHRFNSNENIEQSLLRYVALYNHQLPQSALKSRPLRKP